MANIINIPCDNCGKACIMQDMHKVKGDTVDGSITYDYWCKECIDNSNAAKYKYTHMAKCGKCGKPLTKSNGEIMYMYSDESVDSGFKFMPLSCRSGCGHDEYIVEDVDSE